MLRTVDRFLLAANEIVVAGFALTKAGLKCREARLQTRAAGIDPGPALRAVVSGLVAVRPRRGAGGVGREIENTIAEDVELTGPVIAASASINVTVPADDGDIGVFGYRRQHHQQSEHV